MRKLILLLVAFISLSVSAQQRSCTVYGGTQGNKVTLDQVVARSTDGYNTVYLSKPEQHDVFVNVRVKTPDGNLRVVQVKIPSGETSASFIVDNSRNEEGGYNYSIDSSSCK